MNRDFIKFLETYDPTDYRVWEQELDAARRIWHEWAKFSVGGAPQPPTPCPEQGEEREG